MANKMYVAIGLDKQQLESCDHPKTSPYMQTAHLVFARSAKEASSKATKLLGNRPRIVKQIGIFVADDLGNQSLNALSDKVERIFVTDTNDTNEGVLIGLINPKIGKRYIIRGNKKFKAMAAKAGR